MKSNHSNPKKQADTETTTSMVTEPSLSDMIKTLLAKVQELEAENESLNFHLDHWIHHCGNLEHDLGYRGEET